jgi:hypothetical protein
MGPVSLDDLVVSRRANPAWRLLASPHAPAVIPFADRAFLAPGVRTVPEATLAIALQDVLEGRGLTMVRECQESGAGSWTRRTPVRHGRVRIGAWGPNRSAASDRGGARRHDGLPCADPVSLGAADLDRDVRTAVAAISWVIVTSASRYWQRPRSPTPPRYWQPYQ